MIALKLGACVQFVITMLTSPTDLLSGTALLKLQKRETQRLHWSIDLVFRV